MQLIKVVSLELSLIQEWWKRVKEMSKNYAHR